MTDEELREAYEKPSGTNRHTATADEFRAALDAWHSADLAWRADPTEERKQAAVTAFSDFCYAWGNL